MKRTRSMMKNGDGQFSEKELSRRLEADLDDFLDNADFTNKELRIDRVVSARLPEGERGGKATGLRGTVWGRVISWRPIVYGTSLLVIIALLFGGYRIFHFQKIGPRGPVEMAGTDGTEEGAGISEGDDFDASFSTLFAELVGMEGDGNPFASPESIETALRWTAASAVFFLTDSDSVVWEGAADETESGDEIEGDRLDAYFTEGKSVLSPVIDALPFSALFEEESGKESVEEE